VVSRPLLNWRSKIMNMARAITPSDLTDRNWRNPKSTYVLNRSYIHHGDGQEYVHPQTKKYYVEQDWRQ
jgi:hypothetical protein